MQYKKNRGEKKHLFQIGTCMYLYICIYEFGKIKKFPLRKGAEGSGGEGKVREFYESLSFLLFSFFFSSSSLYINVRTDNETEKGGGCMRLHIRHGSFCVPPLPPLFRLVEHDTMYNIDYLFWS